MSTENNKLIAEFMGLETPDGCYFEHLTKKGNTKLTHYILLKYHISWDWLMPVVEQIESLGIVSFEKNLQEEGDYQCLFTKGDDILICHYADTSIEATYNAVVQFIKEYSKQTK